MESYNSSLLSVIIPVYNLQNYIYNTIQSVLSQDYSNIEVIIVDDGSSDNSWNIIQELADKDPRIRAFKQSNGGAAKARNYGLEKAKGEFIIFVDGDDVLGNDTFKANIKILTECNSLDWVTFSVIRVDKNGERLSIKNEKIYGNLIISKLEYLSSDQFVPKFHNNELNGVCCGTIYRRSSIKSITFPDGEFYEDSFYFTDVVTYTDYGCLSPFGYYGYVHRPNSSQLKAMDHKHLKSSFLNTIKRLRQFRNRFPQFESIYSEWETNMYYFFKNEKSKSTDGANEIFKMFVSEMQHTRKFRAAQEFKILIYRIVGYKNIRRLLNQLHIH